MTRTAARALVDTLVAHGVDRVFCVAGESYLPVLDALVDQPSVDLVTCRHEGPAAFMAVADAKLTGRAGVVLVNRGPGATNAAIALHSAAQDGTPLLLVVGQVRTGDLGRRAFQELEYGRTFGDMAKGVWSVHDGARLAEATARALRVAQAGTPGPVVLVVPEDVFGAPGGDPVPPGRYPPPVPADDDVRRVRDLIAAAQRPVLVAGGRLAPGTAGRLALKAAADRHGLPVLASNKHQDLLDNHDPRYAGHLHIATQAGQRELLAGADLVLAVGTRLDQTTSLNYRWPARSMSLVHVHPDPAALGVQHRPALGLACDPAAFLTRLAAAEPAGVPMAWADKLHAAEQDLAAWPGVTAADGVVFGRAVAELDALTGGELICTVDAGNFTSWVHRHLRFSGRGTLLGISSSAMGFGVPAAVAAALRRPDVPVVAVVGDGGMLMTGTELATAVARRLPLLVLVADNGSYGTIRQHQERAYPGRVIGTDLVNPDFAAMARSFGAYGLSVTDPEQVGPALARALEHPGPSLVHVRTSLTHISAYQRLEAGA